MSAEMNTMVIVQKYNSLLDRMEGKFFSWAMAKHLVGGEKRLARLMSEGRIHGYKPDGAPNSMWQICAVEVIANVKPMVGRVKFP